MNFQILKLLFILISFLSCKKECQRELISYNQGKIEERLIRHYPDCDDKSYSIQFKFNRDGKLILERHFKHGLKSGIQKTWYDNGQLESEKYFVNDLETGISNNWDTNGILRSQTSMLDGEENGFQKCWNQKGVLIYEGGVFNCKKYGTWKFWQEGGDYIERNYINDTLNGIAIEIWANKRNVYGQYEGGLEQGQWIWKDS